METKNVNCAKLGQVAPAIDPDKPEGETALKMCLMVGGPELQKRVRENISMPAWKLWIDHQVMVVNEYRLDPMSDDFNKVIAQHMEAFFFEEQQAIRNYVPPGQQPTESSPGQP